MTKRIEVETVSILDSQVMFTVSSEYNELIDGTVPSGRILSDSDGLAFIYILEREDEFIYISLKNNNWSYLKEGIDQSFPFKLKCGEKYIVLDSFEEELKHLVMNIEGNANYGNTMVEEVERIFLSKSKA